MHLGFDDQNGSHGFRAGITAAASACKVLQALALGYAVRMQGGMPGRTPAIITPPFISPAGEDEPGSTPMNDSTPQVGCDACLKVLYDHATHWGSPCKCRICSK